MARRLVQLKLRLLRNALHASTAAQVSFLVSTTLAILVAIGTFVVLALFRGQSVSVDVTSVTFTVLAFGWLILPIFAFGLDSTLDPATLAIYPLRIRPLVVGLLAASDDRGHHGCRVGPGPPEARTGIRPSYWAARSSAPGSSATSTPTRPG